MPGVEERMEGTALAATDRTVQALEEQAWSERAGYYRIQFDRLSDRWFFSLNGLCETSRETDVVPYYAAEGGVPAERQRIVQLLIEVDIGMGRCGVPPGAPAAELARRMARLPGVRFAGLQAFEGHLVNVLDRAERTDRARAAMQLAIDTRRMLETAGISVACVSGCSSATYDSTGTMPGVDEVLATEAGRNLKGAAKLEAIRQIGSAPPAPPALLKVDAVAYQGVTWDIFAPARHPLEKPADYTRRLPMAGEARYPPKCPKCSTRSIPNSESS